MNIQDNYPYFESNQVLTHSQLNELFTYLDQQNRLTRAKLIGIGIVCGLDIIAPVKERGSTVAFPIKITPGIGITSEGYLVVFEEFFASYYREYILPDGVHYDPFEYEKKDAEGEPKKVQYELTELITKDDYVESKKDTALTASFLEDKVVIVFLEMYDYDPRSCLVRSCDEIGQTRYVKTRVLLARRDIAESIKEKTGLVPSTQDIFPERFDLPVLSIKRVKLTPEEFDSSDDDSDDDSEDSPRDIYSIVLDKYRNSVLEIYEDLIKALKLTYTTYQPILLPIYTENPFETDAVEILFNTKWKNYIKDKTLTRKYFGMQYFYDFIKDLLLAYDEFRIAAFDIVRKCNIDMSLFPRHLFLGEAYPGNASENNPEDNRNGFTQPTIYKDLQEKIEKAKSLHQRIVEMITNFNLTSISDPNNELSLRITPSDEKQSALSNRAIPFYYNIADSESKLLMNWNYELTRRNQANQNLSFHASGYSAPDHVIDPLDYNYDKYLFLRVEGNSGAPSDLVIKDLQALKKNNNLPFDFKLFNLNDIAENIEISDNNSWKDLQTEYISVRDSLMCELQKLVKNLKTPEGNEFSTTFDNLETDITDSYAEILVAIPFNLDSFELEIFSEQINGLFDKLIDYNLYIKYLFGKLLYETYHINTPQQFHEQTQILNSTFHLIRHFMSNCIVYKLITIYYRYQYRKGYLQENSLELFPNFLKENPGVEHDSGVYKKGTYIMLHEEVKISSTVNEDRIVADFALPYMCCSQNLQIPSPEEESNNLNLPPLAVSDYYEITSEESGVILNVLNNDLSRDNSGLEIAQVSESKNGGKVEQNTDGNIAYTPPEDYTGIDSFDYTIQQTSGSSLEDSAQVKVLVRPPYKLQPKAVDDIEFTNIDTEIVIDVLKNDYYNDDTVIELLLLSPNSTLGATLTIEPNEYEKQVIRYTPLVVGRDSFKYSINYPSSELEPSIGEVSVFVGTTASFAALIKTVQKNSTNNKFNVLNSNEELLNGVQITLLNSEGNPVTDNRTEHGTAIVSTTDLCFEYSPDSEYFGADVIYYQVTASDDYSRIDSVNILVMCCCINLPDYEKKVNPNQEYKFDLNSFDEEYPELHFVSLGIIDRDIVEAGIQDETHLLHFVPTNNIAFAGQYTLEYFATDNNKNCYKGKINLTSAIENPEIPDVNVHLTTLESIIIEIPVAEKYGWIIKDFDPLAETLGEIIIINDVKNAFQYNPVGGIENVHAVSFNYTLVNSDDKSLHGKVNLINLISKLSLPYLPETVQKNSIDNQLNVLKENELEFESYKLLIIDSEGNAVSEAETPHGKLIVSEDEGKIIILYTPNTGYFGSDIFEYQIITEEGYYRRGTINLLVMCCCINIPDHEEIVTVIKEYEFDLKLFAEDYPNLQFLSIGIIDKDIVKAEIQDETHLLHFVPTNDIAFAGQYTFEYFATDNNNNCYKGKINLTSAIEDPKIPDINAHLTILEPIIIEISVAEKYGWEIKEFEPLAETLGEIIIINDVKNAFQYNPAGGIENVHEVSFNYTLVNSNISLEGKVNLINLISNPSLTYNPETVQKNSIENQINVLKENELGFESYKLLIIDSEGNTVSEAETPHGKAVVHDNEEEQVILYTPNTGYFGADIFEYQIVTEKGYYRRGTVNMLVMCCCVDLSDNTLKVTPGKEYKIDLENYTKIYPGISFKSLAQIDRDIVKAGIINNTIIIIPGDDIVYAREYSFEYFAIDNHKNCYKGKVNLIADTFDIELPDINVHITTLDPVAIPVEVAEKYQWKINDFEPLNKTYGEIFKLNDFTFNYKPVEGIETVLMVSFNYSLINDKNILKGKVNLINSISSNIQSYIPFSEVNKLIPIGLISGDQFGYSVDLCDQFAIIGARNRKVDDILNNGTAYIFTKNLSGQWIQHSELKNKELQSNNYFGHSVAINNIPEAGYYALVGAYGNNVQGTNAGAVYGFRFDSQKGLWDYHAIIRAEKAVGDDYFGNAIDINNNIAVIGAYRTDIGVANTGCAYVFGLKGEEWIQLQRLQASDAQGYDYFGYTVSIHNSTIVVGAYYEDSAAINAGSCYIFEFDGGMWKEVQKIVPENPEVDEYFGYSSAIYGDWIVVGSPLKDIGRTNAGSASVYKRDNENNTWKLFQTLQADEVEPGDAFGINVVIENDTIIVGSHVDDNDLEDSGSIYIFKLEDNVWVQKQKIQPGDTLANSYFGNAIGLQNNQAIIGAYNDGIEKNRSGSAYIFEQIQLKV